MELCTLLFKYITLIFYMIVSKIQVGMHLQANKVIFIFVMLHFDRLVTYPCSTVFECFDILCYVTPG